MGDCGHEQDRAHPCPHRCFGKTDVDGTHFDPQNAHEKTVRTEDDRSAEQVLDGGGRYAMPGFFDTHVHIDSTLVTPENLSYLIVPHGTTTMLVDPMEIANVAGIKGFKPCAIPVTICRTIFFGR